MPFLRFSRDKRGYESVFLVQATTNRRGKTRPRVLYWFRTPPGLKVGREPFDTAVRRALEAQNPGVTFDWPTIVATPMPPPAPDVERWRERRKAERAAKQAARAEAAAEQAGEPADGQVDDGESPSCVEQSDEPAADALTTQPVEPASEVPNAAPASAEPGHPRRRRRRGRRGNRPAGPPAE